MIEKLPIKNPNKYNVLDALEMMNDWIIEVKEKVNEIVDYLNNLEELSSGKDRK